MSLTDAQWSRIEPLLPDRAPRRGGRWRDHRLVIDAIAFKYRTGTPWMDLPECFGSWKGAHSRLRMWPGPGRPPRSPAVSPARLLGWLLPGRGAGRLGDGSRCRPGRFRQRVDQSRTVLRPTPTPSTWAMREPARPDSAGPMSVGVERSRSVPAGPGDASAPEPPRLTSTAHRKHSAGEPSGTPNRITTTLQVGAREHDPTTCALWDGPAMRTRAFVSARRPPGAMSRAREYSGWARSSSAVSARRARQ
ncbi:transposase [Streptomyces sp. NPDC056540]|uniref:transposase n=1 Tax=Streptomyces sp. NPDC056540 TaxID=3345859 RepID=UPI00369F2A5E